MRRIYVCPYLYNDEGAPPLGPLRSTIDDHRPASPVPLDPEEARGLPKDMTAESLSLDRRERAWV